MLKCWAATLVRLIKTISVFFVVLQLLEYKLRPCDIPENKSRSHVKKIHSTSSVLQREDVCLLRASIHFKPHSKHKPFKSCYQTDGIVDICVDSL